MKKEYTVTLLTSLLAAYVINVILSILDRIFIFSIGQEVWFLITIVLVSVIFLFSPLIRKIGVVKFFFQKWYDLTRKATKKYLPNVYLPEERGGEEYRTEINKHIKESKKLYFLLVNGYSMYWTKEESFILESLDNLSRKEIAEKDIKFGLLDRNCRFFKERAKHFLKWLDREESNARCTLKQYTQRSKELEDRLHKLSPKTHIFFYEEMPIWRFHLFDDCIFVSDYASKTSGTQSLVCQMSDKTSIYTGMQAYFHKLTNINLPHRN